MATPTLLVVDDEDLVRWSVRERMKQSGYDVIEATSCEDAVKRFQDGVDLVLLDFRLPDGDGLSVLRRLRAIDPHALVVLMTAYASIESAVEAMKLGAFHYINKPFHLDEIAHLASRALESRRLSREVAVLRTRESRPYGLERLVGESAAMRELRALVRRVSASASSTVLLTGETGTGKDQVAKTIHYLSPRSARTFVNVTCSALAESLAESELFGHERGSFTDAKERKRGLLELADEGTVFLDEVGELSPAVQAKLLRFLEEKTFKRVGGIRDVRVDVRVIAATNRDLRRAVTAGTFRSDLYHRLLVMPVHLPPLREREGDVPLLATHFINHFAVELGKPAPALAPSAQARLEAHSWPGNVRELRNAIERALLLADGSSVLEAAAFGMLAGSVAARPFELPPSGVNFEELEKDLVLQALERADGNQTRAGALLGMNRYQIRYRLEKFAIAPRPRRLD